jgi:uncharacterized protein
VGSAREGAYTPGVEDAHTRAEQLVAAYDELLRDELPEDADIFDAHTHLGDDIDGMHGRFEEMERIFRRYGIRGAFVFCLDEPDRHPAFRAANDRTLAYAERAGGWLIPFVRLDLTESPIDEAERCLDRGARGIKLHPRAQKFMLTDDRLAPIFALAQERRVPILIHGGRGLPPIANDLAHLVERYPESQLIIAHAGIADLAGLGGLLGGKAGVFFDTSVWSPLDLLDLYRHVGPEQILFASDYPYGQEPAALLLAVRAAKVAGLDDHQLREMLAGNARRIAAGEPPLEPTPAKAAPNFSQPMSLARIHQYLSMATPLLWTRQPDTVGVMGLALNACEEQNGDREHGQIRDLVATAQELWRMIPEAEDEPERTAQMRLTFRLVHLADILAVTAHA